MTADGHRHQQAGLIGPEFVGVWRRDGIAIGGAPPSEPQQVLWLQTPSVFADVRVPLVPGAAPEAFSGTTVRDGDRLTWHHDLSISPLTGSDTALVRWRDEHTLVETGTALVFGAPVDYEEVWRRETRADPSWDVRSTAEGRRVVVGDYALELSPTAGAAFRRTGGVWTPLGPAVTAPP